MHIDRFWYKNKVLYLTNKQKISKLGLNISKKFIQGADMMDQG